MLPGKTHTFSNPMVPKYSANIFSSVPGGRLQTYTEPFGGPLDIYPAICNQPPSYGREIPLFRLYASKNTKKVRNRQYLHGHKSAKNSTNNGIQNKTSTKAARIQELIELGVVG